MPLYVSRGSVRFFSLFSLVTLAREANLIDTIRPLIGQCDEGLCFPVSSKSKNDHPSQ